MYLSQRVKEDIKFHAANESPKECCGFIVLNDFNRLETVKCKNIAENPYHYAKPRKEDYLNADYRGQIKAFYHTHLTREDFSEYDKQKCEFNDLVYILYCVDKDEFSVIEPDSIKNKYINKEFIWGTQDCFSLIREYYKNEFNIEVKDYFTDRKEDWWKNSEDIVMKSMAENNFYEVFEKEKYDLIVFENNKNQFHFAISLDSNILHHPRAKKSIIEPLTDKMIDKIKYILRNKNLKIL